jgi:hypothetical protein
MNMKMVKEDTNGYYSELQQCKSGPSILRAVAHFVLQRRQVWHRCLFNRASASFRGETGAILEDRMILTTLRVC